VTTDHRNLKKTPRRNKGCGDSSPEAWTIMFHIKGHHSGCVSPGVCVPALRGGEENSIGPIHRQAQRTEWPVGQRGVGRDQLAVLGLLDPERGKPQARYGLAQLAPQETLGALALEGLCADNLRSITDLSPCESLSAFGLIDRGETA